MTTHILSQKLEPSRKVTKNNDFFNLESPIEKKLNYPFKSYQSLKMLSKTSNFSKWKEHKKSLKLKMHHPKRRRRPLNWRGWLGLPTSCCSSLPYWNLQLLSSRSSNSMRFVFRPWSSVHRCTSYSWLLILLPVQTCSCSFWCLSMRRSSSGLLWVVFYLTWNHLWKCEFQGVLYHIVAFLLLLISSLGLLATLTFCGDLSQFFLLTAGLMDLFSGLMHFVCMILLLIELPKETFPCLRKMCLCKCKESKDEY